MPNPNNPRKSEFKNVSPNKNGKGLKKVAYPEDIQWLFKADVTARKKWPKRFRIAFDRVREQLALVEDPKAKTLARKNAQKWVSVKLMDACLAGVTIKTFHNTEEILFYNSDQTVFQKGGEMIVRKILRNIDATISMRMSSEVIDKVKTATVEFYENFDANPHIALQKGVLNFDTGVFSPSSPKFLLTRKLNVKYDPEAIPKRILKFILEIAEEDDIPLIFEILAWCLIPTYLHNKIFIFTGKGGNGKTTLLRLFTHFLGPENIMGIPLQDLDTDQYAAAHLMGKLANICADVTAKEVSRTGMAKQLSGGDLLSVNVKYLKRRVSFINSCKLIFAANVLPAIKYDDTDAIWRRIHKIDFNNLFEGERKDPNLIDKLTTPEELSGLLNIIIGSYRGLIERERFVKEKSIKETKKEYVLRSNSIHAFALWGVKYKKHNEVSNPDFFEAFIKFCDFHNIVATSQKYLTETFQIYRPKVYRSRSRKKRYWKHIAIRDNFSIPESKPEKTRKGDTCDTSPVLFWPKNIQEFFKKEHRKRCVTPVTSVTTKKSRMEEKEELYDLLEDIIDTRLNKAADEPVKIMSIVEEAMERGMSKKAAVKGIDEMTRRGIYFEPQQGFIKKP
ncbi:MAG: phage/plasmid primase, P4 family [Candidatus Hodarchaeales archaeon]|jgi:putative DNA primase/helicase